MEYNYIPSKSAFSSMECFLLLKMYYSSLLGVHSIAIGVLFYCMGVHTSLCKVHFHLAVRFLSNSYQSKDSMGKINNTIKSALPVPSVLVRRFSRWVSVEQREWGGGGRRGRPGDQTVPPDSLAARTVPWAGRTAANGGVVTLCPVPQVEHKAHREYNSPPLGVQTLQAYSQVGRNTLIILQFNCNQ